MKNSIIYTIIPESTARVISIFRDACNVENMDAKFGRMLSKQENNVRLFILSQSPILGRIPTIAELRNEFSQYTNEKLDKILNNLDQMDVIHLDNAKKAIVAAYPFSANRTSHCVTLNIEDYKKIYAMCAIDALGICFMFNCGVSINSTCYHCGEEVEIDIEDNQIFLLKPKKVVVWCDTEYSCCAATSICKNINFFSSEKHFAEWQSGQPTRKGDLLQIQEAFYLGKLFFENRL
jgi:hypothetical protein